MPTTIPRTAIKPLLDLTAADLMTTPVRTIPEETSLREAAYLFTREKISGAPVVDREGRCIGVLSSSDFVTWARQDGKDKVVHFIAPWGEMIDIDDSPDNEIRHYMTAQPIAVKPTARVGELAQTMAAGHIHRVLVLADQDQCQGIVTSTDILAAMARAAREVASEGARKPRKEGRPRR
jgi:CBS domain-containing protein